MTVIKPGPIEPGERIEIVDILRGFAVFGILLVNMLYFAHPVYLEAIDAGPWANPLDQAASLLIAFFAEGKFFTLFSLLFGLGLAIQLQRSQDKGLSVVPLYVRRLLVLLLIGLAHAFLFWWGDILIYYALLGFILLLFRHTEPRRLLRWAVAFLIIPLVMTTGLVALIELARTMPEGAAQLEAVLAESEAQFRAAYEQALAVYSSRDFLAMIPVRMADWAFATTGVVLFMLFSILAMFLVGLYAGKQQLLYNAAQRLPLFRRVVIWGAGIGIVGNLLYVTLAHGASVLEPTWSTLIGLVGYLIGAPALSLAYTTGLVILMQSANFHRLFTPLAAVGRTALSNYLLQTLICTTIFYGYGLGFYGQIGPAAGIALTIAIFSLQILLSNWWVKRFHFGPFEWLWRSLTYGKLQPLRLYLLAG
ncbi:DUF418 domain-containing protein [Candidatus Acetothermia bacterium]|jgi:uncharacterized protein|nr:DUF418 domain-containing protein [Candidatus Acetothermia bacterium]MCI2431110.1 DUF418 domain-containing protein [Candidatus Acetothermia bacterium]MCI2437088.1 DUF418 domain-containing protein [Candidatus Acetothermia bacterium]